MLPQKVHEAQRLSLIKATVEAVVSDGLENLTTKTIGRLSGVKEIYIYRYFENKEDLVAKAFAFADEALLKHILENLPVMELKGLEYEMRCRVLFQKCWDFILENPNWLIFYIRYYYSQSFQRYSYAEHMKRYEVLRDKMCSVCRSNDEAETVLHHVIDTLLCQARKQIIDSKDAKQAAEDAFKLVYSVIRSFKEL